MGSREKVPKTKLLCSRPDAPKTKIKTVKHPCGVCAKGVGANLIFCASCKKWVHKKCTGIKGKLEKVEINFVCSSCSTIAVPTNIIPESITINGDVFESVPVFCYLGDVLGQAGGCADAVTSHTIMPGRHSMSYYQY